MRKIYFAAKLFKHLFLIFSFLASAFWANAQTKVTPSSGPFSIPAGVTSIVVECWGGGGKGSTVSGGGTQLGGGGGGGGAYSRISLSSLSLNYTVAVGTGSTITAAGGDSWFGTIGTIIAKGGLSAANNNVTGVSGGLAASGIGTVKYNGGSGANGSGTSYGGGGGASGEISTNGNSGNTFNGGTTTSGGAGGNGKNSSEGAGGSGNIPGGGGGGGLKTASAGGNTFNGGFGGNGRVQISYYLLTNTTVPNTCQNSSAIVTLTSASLQPGTYTVTYDLLGTNTALGNTATLTVLSAGTGTFSTSSLSNLGSTSVKITNIATGIYSSGVGTSNQATFTVTNQAQPTITPGSTTTFCQGGSVILSATAGASSYQWYNDGVSISLATSQTYTASSSAGYTVVAINATGCNSPASTKTTVTVNSLATTPTITPSGPTTFCADGSLTLTSTAASTWQWYKGGVLINGATNSTYSPFASGSYTVVVTNPAGCTSAPSSGTAVAVNPLPPIPTIMGGPTTFCSGLNVVLTSSASSGNIWYDGNGLITGATSTTYTASATSGYLVRVTDANGCTSISSATNVTVNPLPDITIAAQATSLCSSASSQITQLAYTNTDNFPSSYSITWNAAALTALFTNVANIGLPASPISISVPANVAANTYSGTLIAKNANGCQSSSKSFTVTVMSSPNISSFSIVAADGCAGTGAIITVNSNSINAGVYNVKYNLTGASESSNNIATMTFSGNTGTFTAQAFNAGATTVTITEVSLVGCATGVNTSNTANFTINALPEVPPISGPGEVCVNATITLNSSSAGGTWTSSEPSVGTINNAGVVLGLLNGTTVISYTTAPLNGCTNSNTQNITVNALPVVQGITGQTSLCVGTSSLVSNLTANGTWSSSNTSIATIDNTGLVSALAIGTTVITYTTPVDNKGCVNFTTITVTVSPDPVVISGADLDACESLLPAPITLGGASFSGGATSALWSIENSGGGTLSAQGSGNSPATVTYTPPANFYGNITLRLTTNTVGTCGFASATRFINITQKPIATVGSTITVCQNAFPTAIMLSDALVSGSATTGAWSVISGGGTLSDGIQRTDPANVSYTPAANYNGPVILRLTTNAVNICGSTFADRTINITAIPIANAGTQNSICQSASPGTFALTGSSVGGGATTGAWDYNAGEWNSE